MKLVTLLARELKVWPEHAAQLTQSVVDREIYDAGEDGMDQGALKPNKQLSEFHTEDEEYPLVTRADWEAEVARMAVVKPEWIRHLGGKCPVDDGDLVQVRYRDGTEPAKDAADNWAWHHTKDDDDIMAYRICEPEQVPDPVIVGNVDAFNKGDFLKKITTESTASSEEMRERFDRAWDQAMMSRPSSLDRGQCAPVDYADVGMKDELLYDPCARGPLQWRDRIREIDITVEALEEERAGLVQQLEGEGFRLIGKVSAAAEPVGNMSDWRNWRAGDLLECVDGTGWDSFKVGGKYPVKSVTDDRVFMETSCGNPISIISWISDFRWHSRPSA